jgi:hypothetical protein
MSALLVGDVARALYRGDALARLANTALVCALREHRPEPVALLVRGRTVEWERCARCGATRLTGAIAPAWVAARLQPDAPMRRWSWLTVVAAAQRRR